MITLHTHTGTYATSEPRDKDDGNGSHTGTYATSEPSESSDDGGGSNVTIPVVIAVG